MISILHTADWHIGQTFFRSERYHEHAHFFEWLIDVIKKEDIDVLLVAGDVFDVSNPSAEAQRQFYSFIRQVKKEVPHLQLVITAGNHDSASRLEAPLPILEDRRVYVQGVVPRKEGVIDYEQMIIPLYNKQEEVEAYCLAVPYLRQGDYPRVDAANPHSAGVRALYSELIEVAQKKRTSQQALIAMGHLLAVKFVDEDNERSERIIVGGLESVSVDVFKELNYTALGHIHKAQRIDGCEHIRYAGSPLSMSFAEKHYKHGVVKVVVDQGETVSIDKIEYEPLVRLMSIPESGSCLPEQAIKNLVSLPDRSGSEECAMLDPFLEVRVQITEPEPHLAQRLNEAVEGKAVRLVRIRNDYQLKSEVVGEQRAIKQLDTLNPLDIANQVFEDKFGTAMSPELVEIFNEVCQQVHREE